MCGLEPYIDFANFPRGRIICGCQDVRYEQTQYCKKFLPQVTSCENALAKLITSMVRSSFYPTPCDAKDMPDEEIC